jgi:hypothetical protein
LQNIGIGIFRDEYLTDWILVFLQEVNLSQGTYTPLRGVISITGYLLIDIAKLIF